MTGADSDAVLTAQVRAWLVILGASPLAGIVHVRWNARMRTTAGTAHPSTGRIDLNPRLCGVGAGEVERTLRHEAAHLLAHWRAGRRRIQTHGPEWRQACADLGIPGETVTHTLPLRPAVVRLPGFSTSAPVAGWRCAGSTGSNDPRPACTAAENTTEGSSISCSSSAACLLPCLLRECDPVPDVFSAWRPAEFLLIWTSHAC